MKATHIKPLLTTGILCGAFFFIVSFSNGRNEMQTVSSLNNGTGIDNTLMSGISTTIPAYYDARLYNIQFKEFSSKAEATLIAKNPGINFIYQSDPGLPDGKPFISVIDAIPGDGMNPVWREVQIVFRPGFTPRQFYSDDEVLAAASGSNPMITLIMTNEVYSCPVMGK